MGHAEIVELGDLDPIAVLVRHLIVWISTQTELAETHFEGVERKNSTAQGIAQTEDQLDCFECLNCSDDAGEYSKNAGLGTTRS